jgi:hydrogenase maturation protease
MSIAVVGLGCLILSDEGVGVHVVRRLAEDYVMPANVDVIDGGTSSTELLDQLVDAEHIVFVDAARTGGAPGTVVELQGDALPVWFRQRMSPHQIGLAELLAMISLLDRAPKSVTLIGIEPQSLELGDNLTSAVAAAAGQALDRTVRKLAALGAPCAPRPAAA